MEYIVKYKFYIIGGLVLLLSLWIIFPDSKPTPTFSETGSTIVDEKIIDYIYVDLKGEVKQPGVYKVLKGTRLYEAILLAGGLTTEADHLKVNMSILLHDEEVIYIPNFNDVTIPQIINQDPASNLIDINQANQALLETLPGIGPSTAQAIISYREEVGYFDTLEDIMKVSGIGESTYNEIKDYITVER